MTTEEKNEVIAKCPFCQGTGLAECIDLSAPIPDGLYQLNDLIETHGEITKCPEGCEP